MPKTDRKAVPAAFLQRNTPDPAHVVPGAPANLGREVMPHIFTVAGRVGTLGRSYPWYDEALLHSRQNAEMMRTETGIMECLEARQRGTALLRWHVEPRDAKDEAAKDLAKKVTDVLQETWQFLELRRNLLEALWYGRHMTSHQFGVMRIGGRNRQYIRKWSPRQGDKIVFRYDDGTGQYNSDQVGLRIAGGYRWTTDTIDYRGYDRRKIEANTQFGLVYWLDDYERRMVALHRHLIEDGDFFDPRELGRVNGVGIRDRIYWTWYAMQETLANALNFIERNAHGIEIWKYPAGNPQAEARTVEAAENRSNKAVLLVPVMPGELADLQTVEVIEPGFAGLDALMQLITTYFAHKIKRYILGQTLTSEADATGLGSGVADAHMATFADIVLFDSIKLAETISTDIVRPIQLYNFPDSAEYRLLFKIDTESEDMEKKLEAWGRAWEMGAKIPEADLLSMIGARMPDEDDKVLENPQFSQAFQSAMSTQQPGDGGPWKASSTSVFGPMSAKGGDGANSIELKPEPPGKYRRQADSACDGLPEPTESQAKVGNYRMGHIRLHGLDITIETPKGRRRRPEWPEMGAHYGYLKQTKGRDGDHVDVFIGPWEKSELVFVIDQETAGGRFDEHKAMLGFMNQESAERAYRCSYTPDWRVGPVTAMTIDQFKGWLEHGDQTKRVAKQVSKYARSKDSAGQGKFRWVTIPKGNEDGTAVLIDDEGNIGSGPPGLEGKNLNQIDKDVAGTSKDKRKKNTPPPSHGGTPPQVEGKTPAKGDEAPGKDAYAGLAEKLRKILGKAGASKALSPRGKFWKVLVDRPRVSGGKRSFHFRGFDPDGDFQLADWVAFAQQAADKLWHIYAGTGANKEVSEKIAGPFESLRQVRQAIDDIGSHAISGDDNKRPLFEVSGADTKFSARFDDAFRAAYYGQTLPIEEVASV